MRCRICNCILSDEEATEKDDNGDFLDICDGCLCLGWKESMTQPMIGTKDKKDKPVAWMYVNKHTGHKEVSVGQWWGYPVNSHSYEEIPLYA